VALRGEDRGEGQGRKRDAGGGRRENDRTGWARGRNAAPTIVFFNPPAGGTFLSRWGLGRAQQAAPLPVRHAPSLKLWRRRAQRLSIVRRPLWLQTEGPSLPYEWTKKEGYGFQAELQIATLLVSGQRFDYNKQRSSYQEGLQPAF